MTKGWTIGEVARRTGMATSALRFYESAGVLPPAQQDARRRSHRRYDDTVFLRVALIRFAQAVGFSIHDTATFVQGIGTAQEPSERWRDLARVKLPQVETMITYATEVKQALETGLARKAVTWDLCTSLQETAERYQQAESD
jgi:MerR family redox-sensitive transcriptional activator SoxR